jgi:hypothetical protein
MRCWLSHVLLLSSWVAESWSAESSQQLLETFQKLFVAKRIEQLQAVKNIVAMGESNFFCCRAL